MGRISDDGGSHVRVDIAKFIINRLLCPSFPVLYSQVSKLNVQHGVGIFPRTFSKSHSFRAYLVGKLGYEADRPEHKVVVRRTEVCIACYDTEVVYLTAAAQRSP